MAPVILEGWLVKNGNMFGSWKNRFCSLAFLNNKFTMDIYVCDDKSVKRESYTIARKSGFAKVADSGELKNCFSLEVSQSGSGSREADIKVAFSAPTVESYVLWEKAFLNAKAPVGVMPGVGKSFGKPELMVIGASGSVGVATINALAAYSKDFVIKAGVRDVSSPKNAPLVGVGIKLVQADMSKPYTLVPALTGVRVAFIVVPGHAHRTALALEGIRACKSAGVGHVVVLSICSVVKPGTIFADQFIPIEKCTKTCGLPYTLVRLPMLMENVLGQMQTIATTAQFYTPLDSHLEQNCASVGDIGEAVAKIMAKAETYAGKTLSLTGTPVNEGEFATAFSEVLEKPVVHVPVPYSASKQSMMNMGMPEWQVDGVIELYNLIAQGEPCLTTAVSDLPAIIGRRPLTPRTVAASVRTKMLRMSAASAIAAVRAIHPQTHAAMMATAAAQQAEVAQLSEKMDRVLAAQQMADQNTEDVGERVDGWCTCIVNGINVAIAGIPPLADYVHDTALGSYASWCLLITSIARPPPCCPQVGACCGLCKQMVRCTAQRRDSKATDTTSESDSDSANGGEVHSPPSDDDGAASVDGFITENQ